MAVIVPVVSREKYPLPAAHISLNRRVDRSGTDAERQLSDAVARATETAMRFPRPRERLGTVAATEYAAAPDSTFEFGLRSVLDGFEARLAAGVDRGE